MTISNEAFFGPHDGEPVTQLEPAPVGELLRAMAAQRRREAEAALSDADRLETVAQGLQVEAKRELPDEMLVSVATAAEALGLSVLAFRWRVRRGTLPAGELRGSRRFWRLGDLRSARASMRAPRVSL